MSAYVRNIHRMFDLATAEDVHAGLLWYPQAHQLAREVSVTTRRTLAEAAYAIAALSPRTSWAENVRAIWIIADAIKAGRDLEAVQAAHLRVTKVNRAKAWMILTTGNLDAIGNGPKTRAFADNILHPWQSTAVTIDSWAYRIAAGLVGVTDEFKVNLRGKVYEDLAAAYSEVSDILNFLPLTVQAITWVAAHRLEGKA